MNILFVAGGTAGHINPAIAIADYFKTHLKHANIKFVGNDSDTFKNLIEKAGYEFIPIKVAGLHRKISLMNFTRNLNALYLLLKAQFEANAILKTFKPKIVIGTGGYTCAAVLMQANRRGILTAIHEQNAHPGVTNRLLAKKSSIVFLAVKEAKSKLPKCNSVVVGNPVRKSILNITKQQARKTLNMDDNFCILSFGGSLGARKINEIAADLMEWHCKFKKINHIHAMGKLGSDYFPKMLNERNIVPAKNPRLIIRNYIHNMDVCLACCDLVICRAGALTLAEIQATGTPAILIPSPNVTGNHQYYNAMILQKNRAAIVVEEKNYNKFKLIKLVNSLYENKSLLHEFSRNSKLLAMPDSTKLIFDNIMLLLKNGKF